MVLDGKVSGLGLDNRQGAFANNLPLVGATLEVHATDAATGERRGDALLRKTIGADGRWGPFTADPRTPYEFVIAAPGYATTHIYRSPFPRSSEIVNLRAERLADADKDALAVVTLTRPRGYFGVPRDRIALDGKSPPAGIPPGTPGISTAKLKVADAAQPRRGRRIQRRAHRRPGLAGRGEPRGAARTDVLNVASPSRPRPARRGSVSGPAPAPA